MDKEYLTPEHLVGFENYKYSCKDTSPLSIYVMHPFWNKVVEYCPRWLAPNTLTFVGFLFTLFAYLLFVGTDYDFYAADDTHPEVSPLPRWIYMVAAISIFLAYTLDGIDGKQARKTGSSGPLGELFDHGLDSCTAGLLPAAMYSIFGRNPANSISPLRMYYVQWNILVNFYVSHWEKYNTGVLFLPWGYDLSMWGTILAFFVAGIGGHEIWQFTLPGGLTAGRLCECVLYVSSLISNLPFTIVNIYRAYNDRTGKMRPFSEAIRPLIPVLYLLALCSFWAFKSNGNIVERDPRALFFMTGTIFSNICCRLIVAQMSNTRCELFNWLLVPTTLVVLISVIVPSVRLELALLYGLSILVTVAHIHYGTTVVQQMCRHFKINCFKIRSQPEEHKE